MRRDEPSPFKHTGCGGVLIKRRWSKKTVYCCDKCGAEAVRVDELLFTASFIRVIVKTNQLKAEK